MRRQCERLGGINLASGTCELPTPPEVALAGVAALHAGHNVYSLPEGIPSLRQAIAEKLTRDNGITADAETEVSITSGATIAYASVLAGLLDPGDEIVLFEPFYSWHRDTARMLGVVPRFVRLHAPAFRIDEEALRASVNERTRAIVVCTPSNPSGRVLSEQELRVIAQVAEEHDLFVISDEVYEYLVYEGRRHVSPRSMPGGAARTVSIMGLSKTFNVTGWRIGYVVGRPDLTEAICTAHELLATCAPTPMQHAATAALAQPESYYRELREGHQRRRDLLVETLSAIGMEPLCPEGAYFVLAGISKLGFESSSEAALEILGRTRVAAVPDTAFYERPGGGGFLRFCFAREEAELAEGCRRLRTL